MKVASQNINLYNMVTPEVMKDTGDNNTLNSDNKIFLSRRSFVYSYKVIKNNTKNLCAIYLDMKCIEEKRQDCIDWNLFKYNGNKDIFEYPIENIKMYVFEKKSNTSLSNTQTLIKYEYFNKKGRIFFGERTGLIEDSIRVFIHQPRQYVFAITELNPFPEIRHPLIIGNEWKATNTIPQQTLKLIRSDYLKKNDFISRNLTYKIVGKIKIKTKLGKLECYKIKATAEGFVPTSSMIAYFNKKLGFVKIIYKNIDNSVIVLNLDAFNDIL